MLRSKSAILEEQLQAAEATCRRLDSTAAQYAQLQAAQQPQEQELEQWRSLLKDLPAAERGPPALVRMLDELRRQALALADQTGQHKAEALRLQGEPSFPCLSLTSADKLALYLPSSHDVHSCLTGISIMLCGSQVGSYAQRRCTMIVTNSEWGSAYAAVKHAWDCMQASCRPHRQLRGRQLLRRAGWKPLRRRHRAQLPGWSARWRC